MASEELLKHQEEMAYKRRVYAQARAIIQRGRNAGIPDKYLRIGKKDFTELLDPKYHGDIGKFADAIYDTPKKMFKKSFIIIDGGDIYSRKKAGFAILFRMIACDKYGKYFDCAQLASEFQTIKFSGGENRNDLVRNVKQEGILFLNEFHKKKFSVNLGDSGGFFDQLLEYRDDYSKPTIITFSNPLQKGFENNGNALMDDRCGQYLAMLSKSDMKKNDNVLRIKVI
jgi:hypothetical protein